MRSKSSSAKKPVEQVVKDIRRATRRHFSAEVDELMALCNHLKYRVADAAQTQCHLADAITERAAA